MKAREWLPASMPHVRKALAIFPEQRFAVDYYGSLYASNGRTAFRVGTKLARADRRIPQKDSKGAFGKKRMPKIALPKAATVATGCGPKRAEIIDGHSYDARYLRAIRAEYRGPLTYDVFTVAPCHVLCVFDGKGMVAAIASLRDDK